MVFSDLFQDAFDPARISAISHAYGHDDATRRVAQGIVRHHACDQIRVGHNHVLAVKRLNPSGANGNVANIARYATNRYPVAQLDRSFDEQNNTRHKVRHDRLKTKTDTDLQRTSNNCKAGQVDPCEGNRNKRGDEKADVAGPGQDGVLTTTI